MKRGRISLISSLFILFHIFLSGCATYTTISSNAMASLDYGMSEDIVTQRFGVPPLQEILFLNEGNHYLYLTHKADTYKYYGFLFQNGQLDTVAEIRPTDAFWRQNTSRCTRFPVVPTLDVGECFSIFVKRIRTNRIDLKAYMASEVNQKQKERERTESVGAIAEGATVAAITAPIFFPAVAVAAPLAAVEQSKRTTKLRILHGQIKLGADISGPDKELIDVPKHMMSVNGENESILIPGGAMGLPVMAFGAKAGVVIWIDHYPRAGCKSFPSACTLGGEYN